MSSREFCDRHDFHNLHLQCHLKKPASAVRFGMLP